MAKKPGSLFFSTLKRAARLQQKAMKLVGAVPASKPRKPRKPPKKKTAARPVARRATVPRAAAARKAAPRSGPPAAAKTIPTGKGRWQNLIHKTPPSRTELLGRLAYALYRPAGGPIAGMPLVIMLHGCQQTPYEMALGTGMNRLADSRGFVVAYPQQVKRLQALRCWRWFQPDRAHGLAEADAIADLVRSLVRMHRLDAARVYIAGLSAGAGMAALTVIRHPRLFAAAALHSGTVVGEAHSVAAGVQVMRRGGRGDPVASLTPLLTDFERFPGIPVMILHGRRDRVVSMPNAIQLAEQFAFLNGASLVREAVLARGTHREYERQDFLKAGRPVVRLCLLKEVGHAWSGGDARLKFHSEKGPNASVLIRSFFAMHDRVRSRFPADELRSLEQG